MTLELKNAFWIIIKVAEENDFTIDKISEENYQLHFGKYHAVDFEVTSNSSGYIQCKQWDTTSEEYSRAVYSIRNVTDVVSFCSILISSASIRAKRQ